MARPNLVLDTNVVVTALRSKRGASFKLLSLVGTGRFDLTVSVPLVLEYEDVLLRHQESLWLQEDELQAVLDYLCASAHRAEIFFLWRPSLPDPKDDLLLEVAVAGRCDAILTYNRRDFLGIERFGLRALTPQEFLHQIGELP
jgi:putative PIN family toxin of toxin-antitoxin system